MSESLICGFCGEAVKPVRIEERNVVKYYCENCNSLIAAYQKEFEEKLKFGKLFKRRSLGNRK